MKYLFVAGLLMLCGAAQSAALDCKQEVAGALMKLSTAHLNALLQSGQQLKVSGAEGKCPDWLGRADVTGLQIEMAATGQLFAKQRLVFAQQQRRFNLIFELELSQLQAKSRCALQKGQEITADCLQWLQVRQHRLELTKPTFAVLPGQRARRELPAGVLLQSADLVSEDEVYAGQNGTLLLQRGSLMLQVAVRFIRPASVGQLTQVQLDHNKELIEVRVGPGQKVYLNE